MAERVAPLFRFGVFNPTHFIVAVTDDAEQAEQAFVALKSERFGSNDAQLIPGQQVLDNERTYGDSKGVLARLAGLFPSEEQAAVKDYVERAERGAHFVIVRCPEKEQRNVARNTLASHGGYAMRYYGENMISDL